MDSSLRERKVLLPFKRIVCGPRKKMYYAQIHGNILVEVATSHLNPFEFYQQKELTNVEPFTIVTIETQESEICHLAMYTTWSTE